MLTLLKAATLVLCSALFLLVVKPPKAPAANVQTNIYKGQFFEHAFRYLANTGCIVVCASEVCHAIIIVLYENPSKLSAALIPWLCPTVPPSLEPLASYCPRFIAGVMLVLAGAIIRVQSFKTLGALFTFEVFMKDEHTLITIGPYKYVRHPSYTGLIMVLLGTHLISFGIGGFVTECRIEATPWVFWTSAWRLGALYASYSLYKRCSVEDTQLHDRFGDAWRSYSKRVPYRLFPYVY